ncbi:MAG: UDP-3-O-acyl-N-acetylglucosamine deacetylase [Pirellulaceae bacterium]|nr:UDP-3-O-acyl-N-acetylglucosamine deacetylase [Pirellulaceae bacterium]
MTTNTIQGVSLHSGHHTTVRVERAAAGKGWTFWRNGVAIPATIQHAVPGKRGRTLLERKGYQVEVTEHVLAALMILRLQGHDVDDVDVHVDGCELPILDGSVRPWVEFIRTNLDLPRDLADRRTASSLEWLTPAQKISHSCRMCSIQVSPGDPEDPSLEIAADASFHPQFTRYRPAGEYAFSFNSRDPGQLETIARMPTFYWQPLQDLMEQVDKQKAVYENNEEVTDPMYQGASEYNIVTPIQCDSTYMWDLADRNLCRETAIAQFNPAAHKVADFLGDLALMMNLPIADGSGSQRRYDCLNAHVSLLRNGHQDNQKVMRSLLSATIAS